MPRSTYHLFLYLRLGIVEVGMEQTLETSFRNLIRVVFRMVPCMHNKPDGINDDNLGEISGRFVDYQRESSVSLPLHSL